MKVWTSSKVLGICLTPWKWIQILSSNQQSLYTPTLDGKYPVTFIAVRCEGDIWTWESREDFHSLTKELPQFEVDVLS